MTHLGMPKTISASQIEQFDPTTPFGCPRRWWYERIADLPKGDMAGVDLGQAVHTSLETFLTGGPQGGLHELVIGAHGALEWLIALRPRIQAVELKIEPGVLTLAGIPVTGRIDWVAKGPLQLGDHKTSSDIKRYGKTAQEIKDSTQMNVYAAFLAKEQEFDSLLMTQDYYQTKRAKKFEVVTCTTSKVEIAERILKIESVVERMKVVATKTNPEDVEPDTSKCNVGFGCPHRAYCPRSGVVDMASLMDAFFPAAKTDTSVLPPDAPKSDPLLASEPPKIPTKKIEIVDVPDEKPAKRGRPPGSQNKPKDLGETPIFHPDNKLEVTPTQGPIQIERITIRHGAWIGMPNHSGAKVEVEATGYVTGPLEEAKESLSMQVKAMMRAELSVYVPEKK